MAWLLPVMMVFVLTLHTCIPQFDLVSIYLALTETDIDNICKDKDNKKAELWLLYRSWKKNRGIASYPVLVTTFLHVYVQESV